jgi:hypothetical protein
MITRRIAMCMVMGGAVILTGVVASEVLAVARAAAARWAPATAAEACLVPGPHEALAQVWRPRVGAAIRYLRRRSGNIAFAVRTKDRLWGYRVDHVESSASVLKAMLLVAYLDRPSVARRSLTARERALPSPMITRSDNDAADAVDEIVGDGALDALARHIAMQHFRAVLTVLPMGRLARVTA